MVSPPDEYESIRALLSAKGFVLMDAYPGSLSQTHVTPGFFEGVTPVNKGIYAMNSPRQSPTWVNHEPEVVDLLQSCASLSDKTPEELQALQMRLEVLWPTIQNFASQSQASTIAAMACGSLTETQKELHRKEHSQINEAVRQLVAAFASIRARLKSPAETPRQLPTYSFRCEHQYDFDDLIHRLVLGGYVFSIMLVKRGITKLSNGQDFDTFEVLVELTCELPLEELRDVMRQMEDAHVMVRTLRACPMQENSMEWDFTLP